MTVLTKDNFLSFAQEHYDNPHCTGPEEFFEDLRRVNYIKRLFRRYMETGDLQERLIINHIIVLYNVFGVKPLVLILFFRMPEYRSCLKSFLGFIQVLPKTLTLNNEVIDMTEIETDDHIIRKLKGL